jgi:hypothetical protein
LEGGWVVRLDHLFIQAPFFQYVCFLLVFVAALQTSYQLNDADYSGGDLEGGWVVRLAGCLQLQLLWLQPLLTPACWEGLTLLLLDKLLARLEVLLGRKVGGFQNLRLLPGCGASLGAAALGVSVCFYTQALLISPGKSGAGQAASAAGSAAGAQGRSANAAALQLLWFCLSCLSSTPLQPGVV